MIAVLNRWASFVYGPLLDDRARMIQEKKAGGPPVHDGRGLVDSVHQDIRRLGGIAPPRAFVFMDRAAIISARCSSISRPRSTGTACSTASIDDFDEAVLAERQKKALKEAGVPEVPTA